MITYNLILCIKVSKNTISSKVILRLVDSFEFNFILFLFFILSTKTTVPMGHAGLLIDGVGWYNPSDAISYNSLGVWNRNAFYWEYSSFDSCNGHPAPTSYEYHIHVLYFLINLNIL